MKSKRSQALEKNLPPLSNEEVPSAVTHPHTPPRYDDLFDQPDLAFQKKLSTLDPHTSQIPDADKALQRFRQSATTTQSIQPAHAPQKTPAQPQFWAQIFEQLRGSAFWKFAGAGVALAALSLMFFFPGMPTLTPTPHTTPRYQAKGQAHWTMLYAKAPTDPTCTKPTHLTKKVTRYQHLSPEDLIQFVYKLPGPQHLMIVNIDQKGQLSSCVPFLGKKSIRVEAGQGTLPKGASLELDENVGFERFFIIFSDAPFTLAQLKTAFLSAWQRAGRDLRKLKHLTGPWSVRTFLIVKQHNTSSPSGTPKATHE